MATKPRKPRKSAKTTVIPARSLISKRMVVLPDTHGELVDRAAFECALQAIEVIKPDIVCHIGDVGEWSSVNHHRYKRLRTPDPAEVAHNVRKDARATAKYVLNPLDEACARAGVTEKIMIEGNHDRWLNHFVDANPDYADTPFDEAAGYRFDQIYDWKKRGWRVQPCGKLLKMGKLHLYHGQLYGGVHHARQHLVKMGVNVMYGHWHDFQAAHITHADGPKGAYSIGCLKSHKPEDNEWLEHRPVNWQHMFAVVDFYDGGKFSIHPVTIIDGRCTLLGIREVIDGRKPRKLVAVKRGSSNKRPVRG